MLDGFPVLATSLYVAQNVNDSHDGHSILVSPPKLGYWYPTADWICHASGFVIYQYMTLIFISLKPLADILLPSPYPMSRQT